MEEYRGNSHKQKESEVPKEKKLEPVVTGSTEVRKESGIEKVKKAFVSEDATSVRSFILFDVIIPGIKKNLVDAITSSVNMIFYGTTANPKKSNPTNASFVSYRNYYSDSESRTTAQRSSVSSAFNYNENILFDTRGDAELVLSTMEDALECYGNVSIADMYDLAHITIDPQQHSLNKYGWTNLSRARIMRVNDGYIIKLPRAVPL